MPLTVVGLSGDGALSGWVSVLVSPLPVDAADDPSPWDDVLHHLGTKKAALATKVCFCLLHSFTCVTMREKVEYANISHLMYKLQVKKNKIEKEYHATEVTKDSVLTELVLTDSRDGAVQLESRQRQVVSLTTGVLPHLFDPNVSPALLLIFGRVQRPRGRRPVEHTHYIYNNL